jgi:hypothetical protein
MVMMNSFSVARHLRRAGDVKQQIHAATMDFVDRRLPFPNRSKMVVENSEVNGLDF